MNKAALGSCPLPLIVFQRVWVCRSIGAPVKGWGTLPLLSVIPDSAAGGALPSQTFQVVSQLLTKAHRKTRCPCLHCEEVQQIDFSKVGTRDFFLPDPSPMNLLSPEESLPVHACCLQVMQDFADCLTCLNTKRARAQTDIQVLDTLMSGNCPISVFLLPV